MYFLVKHISNILFYMLDVIIGNGQTRTHMHTKIHTHTPKKNWNKREESNCGVEAISGQGCPAQIAYSFWKFSVILMVLTVSDEVLMLEPCDVDACDIKADIKASTSSLHFAWNALIPLGLITNTYSSISLPWPSISLPWPNCLILVPWSNRQSLKLDEGRGRRIGLGS